MCAVYAVCQWSIPHSWPESELPTDSTGRFNRTGSRIGEIRNIENTSKKGKGGQLTRPMYRTELTAGTYCLLVEMHIDNHVDPNQLQTGARTPFLSHPLFFISVSLLFFFSRSLACLHLTLPLGFFILNRYCCPFSPLIFLSPLAKPRWTLADFP